MTEIAFLVKPDSEMYRKYFKQKNELDKFVGFASVESSLSVVLIPSSSAIRGLISMKRFFLRLVSSILILLKAIMSS